MAPFRKFYKRRFPKAKAKAKARPTSVKAICSKMIKASLSKVVETKLVQVGYQQISFNSGATGSGDATNIVPALSQGDGISARTGNRVYGMNLEIRGHLFLVPNDSQGRANVQARVMIVTPKVYRQSTIAIAQYADWIDKVLINGTGFLGLNGTIESMYLPVNKKAVTVHADRKFYISNTATLAAVAPGIGPTAISFYTTNNYKDSYKPFVFNIPIKKNLDYQGNLDDKPTNFGPVMLVSYVYLDNRVSADTSTTGLQCNFNCMMKFKDA